MASSLFPVASLAADLSAAFEQALSQKGAGQRHAIQELWGNAMDRGDTAQLTALDILIVPRAFLKSVLGGGKALPWTRLERWLDRHAATLFSVPSDAGSSFDGLLAGHFPEWSARRRRQALLGVASPRREPGATPKL